MEDFVNQHSLLLPILASIHAFWLSAYYCADTLYISLLAYTSVILEGRLLLRSWKMHKFASTASNCLLFSVGIPEIENLVLLYSARVWIRLLYGEMYAYAWGSTCRRYQLFTFRQLTKSQTIRFAPFIPCALLPLLWLLCNQIKVHYLNTI